MKMFSMWRRRVGVLLFLLIPLALAACDKIPDETVVNANVVKESIPSVKSFVEGKQAEFIKRANSPEFTFFAPYAKKEDWSGVFTKALSEVARAGTIFTNSVQPLLDENKSKDTEVVTAQLGRIKKILADAKASLRKPGDRMSSLENARDNASERLASAMSNLTAIDRLIADTALVVERYETNYSDRKDAVGTLFAPLKSKQVNAKEAFVRVQKQFTLHETKSGVADYAVLTDSASFVESSRKELSQSAQSVRKTLTELDKSYSKILVDMRADYFVQIGRTAWDSWSDWPTEHNFTYNPAQVDEDTHEYFASLTEGTLATGSRRGIRRVQIDSTMWNKLKIDPIANWPRGDDDSQFWLSDVTVKYYHKYTLVTANKREDTDWIAVSEEDFEAHEEHLMMTIVAKPFGSFESEVSKQATPPGMEYVGNPKYGRWEADPDRPGERRWSFLETYAMYHLLFGGSRHYYGYGAYSTYDRDFRGRRAYYGSTASSGQRYGTSGTRTASSSNAQKSTFAKRGGGLKANTARGAGQGARNRGPGKGK